MVVVRDGAGSSGQRTRGLQRSARQLGKGGVLCGRVGLVGWLNGLQVVVGRVGVGVVCWPGRGVEAGWPNGCSQMRVRM